MENRRMMLIALLGVIAYFIYQAWQQNSATTPETPSTAQASADSAAAAATQLVRIVTDVQTVELSLRGGDIHRVELNAYSVSKDKQEQKLALLNDRDGQWSVLQTGLVAGDRPLGGPDSVYTAEQHEYRLADGVDALNVVLVHRDDSGLEVRKRYTFTRGSYVIELQQTLANSSSAAMQVSPYAKFVQRPVEAHGGAPFAQGFAGFGVYQQASPGAKDYKFKKLAYKDLAKTPFETAAQDGGWVAMLQHYFFAAILPPEGQSHSFSAKPSTGVSGAYVGQYLGGAQDVAAGGNRDFPVRIYIGPETHGNLETIAPGLALTEDYGVLTPIASLLFWVLKAYHTLTSNWGIAIILLTLTVKLVFYKLSEAQYRSAAKMRKFGPRLQELKERFADDREKLNKAMMELYKKEGFNPLAGCWPILVQFPVFIGLYWVLAQSVELRQAPFALWWNDLTAADPYFVLPVLYGISMWAQQKLSGQAATMDPTQARIMNIMPVMLAGMFAFMPSGLVLYWFISNVIGIAQQWVIIKRVDGGAKA